MRFAPGAGDAPLAPAGSVQSTLPPKAGRPPDFRSRVAGGDAFLQRGEAGLGFLHEPDGAIGGALGP